MTQLLEVQFSFNLFTLIFLVLAILGWALYLLGRKEQRKIEREIIEEKLGIITEGGEKKENVPLSYEALFRSRANYLSSGGDDSLLPDELMVSNIKTEIVKAETFDEFSKIFKGYVSSENLKRFSKRIHLLVLEDSIVTAKIIRTAEEEWGKIKKIGSKEEIDAFALKLKQPFFYDPDLNFDLWPRFFKEISEEKRK